MKAGTSFTLTGALLIVIASAAIAAAQTGNDTCAGLISTIGGTCTPLTNTTSGNNANTVFGSNAGGSTTGSSNTAIGANALQSNTIGSENTSIGVDSLEGSKGGDNTVVGFRAGQTITTGSNNIVIGANGGHQLAIGDNNIDIGFAGDATPSNSNESSTIRIGTGGKQTATFIHGIFNSPGTKKACQVVVQSNAKLGCMASSARYKHDIRNMGTASDKLMKLRPVIFQYKEDSTGIRQYGLIAEEVEKVYPELVIDGDDGRAQTVAYQELPAMLLNEVQKERRQLAQKNAEIAAMRRQLVALQKKNSEIDTMAERLDALERQARVSRPDHLAVALH
jgi:polyhydroxyalkanoate synthesis regulator phasin